jgi:transposase
MVSLIRFGGHLSKGGYDVQTDGRHPKRRPRRRFDDDFKAQAVRLVLDEGKSVGSVAADLTETALRKWVHRTRADRTRGKTGLTTAEHQEFARLRKEIRILRDEREILQNHALYWLLDRYGERLPSLSPRRCAGAQVACSTGC